MTWISYGITVMAVVPLLDAAPYTPDAISDRGILSRIVNHHPIAIQTAAKKLIGRSPQIQAEAPIVEFAEALDNKIPLGVEVAGPLLEGEEIAVPVVEDFQRSQRRLGKPAEKVVQNQEGMVPGIDVFHHERRKLVLPGAGTAVQ